MEQNELLGNRTSPKADAVLFATNKIGVMAIECIASFGLKIPYDVPLVRFVNADAYKICISCGGLFRFEKRKDLFAA